VACTKPGAFPWRTWALLVASLAAAALGGVTAAADARAQPRSTGLRVLAVGDSMMMRVARHLGSMLEDWPVRYSADIHLGAPISSTFVLDWRAEARLTAATARPDVVVVFVGGGEGWPFGSVQCCGAPWISEYASRTRQIMQTYMRDGAARVYWLTLPAPRSPTKVAPLAAANVGLAQAAAGLEPWTRLVDVANLITPGFVYRDSMLLDGRPVPLRMADGLHLSRPGAILTARLVTAMLRQDGVLPPSLDRAGRYRRTRFARPAKAARHRPRLKRKARLRRI
jgi:hypothetical protein